MCSPTSALVWNPGAFAPLGGWSQSTGVPPVLCRFEKEVSEDREHLSFRSKALHFPNLKFSSGHAPRAPPPPQHSFPVLLLLVPGDPRSELAWIHRKVREKPVVSASLGMQKVSLNDSGSSLS